MSLGRSRWANQRTTMKRNGRSRKYQKARPRSRTFAQVYSAVPRDGPWSLMMLFFRRSQAP
eukprot:3361173-Pleurochrysis_carterae.AAC.1